MSETKRCDNHRQRVVVSANWNEIQIKSKEEMNRQTQRRIKSHMNKKRDDFKIVVSIVNCIYFAFFGDRIFCLCC